MEYLKLYFKFVLPLAPILCALSSPAFSADDEYLEWVEGNGLSLYPSTATKSQKDPLTSVVDITFGSNVSSVGKAIDILLMPTGYRLPNEFAADPFMKRLLKRPLPKAFQKIGPVPVYVALDALAGDEFVLVTDDLHSLVGFDLLPNYRRRYASNSPYSFVPESYNSPPNIEQVWFIREGEKFSDGMKRWAKSIGWTLRWNDLAEKDDILLDVNYRVTGSFYGAVAEAMSHFELHGESVNYHFLENVNVLFVTTTD